MVKRAEKITLGEMRSSGAYGLVVFCSDYKCAHSVTISAEDWPDDVRLSDLEPQFVCKVCGHRGADIRPNFPPGYLESTRCEGFYSR
jgi:hypothetical protein